MFTDLGSERSLVRTDVGGSVGIRGMGIPTGSGL